MFHVGQNVVCVDANFSATWQMDCTKQRPVRNGIYTVRAFGSWNFSTGLIDALWLCEVNNPVVRWRCGDVSEVGFAAWRFRPVVAPKTDISIFTEMLTPAPKRARETSEG